MLWDGLKVSPSNGAVAIHPVSQCTGFVNARSRSRQEWDDRAAMLATEYWECLKGHGYTKHRVLDVGPPRMVVLESRDTGDFPSIAHPDDLTFDERVEVLSEFLRHRS